MYRRSSTKPGNPFGFEVDHKPTELFPQTAVPVQATPSEEERQAAAQFLSLRQSIREGPLYTGSANARKGRVVVEVESAFDDGIKRYTDRYVKRVKIGRSVDEHPYVVKFFPPELHGAMGLKSKKQFGIAKFKKGLQQTYYDTGDKTSLLARIDQAGEEAEREGGDEKEAESDPEDYDDEYDDEDDDNDDYNAEKYFDGGDSMDEGDDGGDDEAAY